MRAKRATGTCAKPSALLALFLLGCPAREAAPPAIESPPAPFSGWEYYAATDVADPSDFRLDADGRASLLLTTLGTDPATVKVHGLMSPYTWKLSAEPGMTLSINATLEWTDHPNGSYLSMDIVLAPNSARADPTTAADSIRFAYVGVPPLRNARALLEERRKGALNQLYTEGFPQTNTKGREIGRTAVTLLLRHDGIELVEDGRTLFRADAWEPPLKEGRIFLLQTGHSNYPTRTVRFSEPKVTRTN